MGNALSAKRGIRRVVLLFALPLIASSVWAAAAQVACAISVGDIVTVAGTGTAGFAGDGGPATRAEINNPTGIVFDGSGNLYVADALNNRVRKIDTDGTITTVAGSGTAGFAGDGGPATRAELRSPVAVVLDKAGDIYVADSDNCRVRKIDANGTITTVAGNGTAGLSGDGGPATSAQLGAVGGIAFDNAGNLFVADWSEDRIRKIDTYGTITTLAGTGTAGFSGDGGAAASAQINRPEGICFDSSGNLYFADSWNSRIRKIDSHGTISTVAGNATGGYSGDGGPATSAGLAGPRTVTIDAAGSLFVLDTFDCRVRKIDSHGTISTVAGNGTPGYSGDGGPATSAKLNNPFAAVIDSVGNVYFSDASNHRIRKICAATVASKPRVSPARPIHNKKATFSATLTPGAAATLATSKLYLYRQEKKSVTKTVKGKKKRVRVTYWHLRSKRAMTASASGLLKATTKLAYKGKWKACVIYAGCASWTPGTSPATTFTVK